MATERQSFDYRKHSHIIDKHDLHLPDGVDVGKLIGKGGSNIKDLQKRSGARIEIKNDKLAVITGSEDAIQSAVGLINVAVGHPDYVRTMVDIPDNISQMFTMGAQAIIEDVQNKYSVEIWIENRDIIIQKIGNGNVDAAETDIQSYLTVRKKRP